MRDLLHFQRHIKSNLLDNSTIGSGVSDKVHFPVSNLLQAFSH